MIVNVQLLKVIRGNTLYSCHSSDSYHHYGVWHLIFVFISNVTMTNCLTVCTGHVFPETIWPPFMHFNTIKWTIVRWLWIYLVFECEAQDWMETWLMFDFLENSKEVMNLIKVLPFVRSGLEMIKKLTWGGKWVVEFILHSFVSFKSLSRFFFVSDVEPHPALVKEYQSVDC